MDTHVPFVHFLKEIVINYRRSTAAVSPRVQDDVGTCDGPELEAQLSTEMADDRGKAMVKKSINSQIQKKPFSAVTCCGYTFNYPSHYQKHLKSIRHSSWQCYICKEICNSKESHDVHRKEKHSDHDGKWICQTAAVSPRVQDDVGTCDGPELEAQLSTEMADDRGKAMVKKSINSQIEKKTFSAVTCCGYTFNYPSHYQKHLKSIRHSSWQCGICKEICNSKESYDVHRKEKHSDHDGKWICQLCNAECASNGILTRHMRNVHETKLFQCDFCSHAVRRKEKLLKHIKRKHTKDYDNYFCCDMCKRKFVTKYMLLCHIKNVHDKNRYQCDVCTRTYDDIEHRDLHRRTHFPEQHFGCQVCGRKFKTYRRRETHFMSHMKAKHRKKKTESHMKAKPRKEKTENNKRQRQASSESSKFFDCSKSFVSDSVIHESCDSSSTWSRDMKNNSKSNTSVDESKSSLNEDLLLKETNDTNKLHQVILCQPQFSFLSSSENMMSKCTGDEPGNDLFLLPSDEIEGKVKSDCDDTVLYSPINKDLKTQTGNMSTLGVSVSVDYNKCSEVEVLPILKEVEILKMNCVSQHQSSSGKQDQFHVRPCKLDPPDSGAWLTEIINGNNTQKGVKKNRNYASIPRKAREMSVKPVAQDVTISKLRQRIKNIFQQDGPKVFIKHLVNDESDVFLLPEFFTEDDYENLAPGVEDVQDTVVLDASPPVVYSDECQLLNSITTAVNTDFGRNSYQNEFETESASIMD